MKPIQFLLFALVAVPTFSQADLRPVRPSDPETTLVGRHLHFQQAYRIPALIRQSNIVFAHQSFQGSHLGVWEAGCRLVAKIAMWKSITITKFLAFAAYLVRTFTEWN